MAIELSKNWLYSTAVGDCQRDTLHIDTVTKIKQTPCSHLSLALSFSRSCCWTRSILCFCLPVTISAIWLSRLSTGWKMAKINNFVPLAGINRGLLQRIVAVERWMIWFLCCEHHWVQKAVSQNKRCINMYWLTQKTVRAHSFFFRKWNVFFFDSFPRGLEDVSKYPALIEELLHRNWTDHEVADVLRRNFQRVFEEVERVRSEICVIKSF